MVITLVSMPLFCFLKPVIHNLLAFVRTFRYRCYLSRQSWRSTSSLLLDSRQHRVRGQSRLDQSTVQHHVSSDWEDVRCLFDITASWTCSFLAKMVPLHQYCLVFCIW